MNAGTLVRWHTPHSARLVAVVPVALASLLLMAGCGDSGASPTGDGGGAVNDGHDATGSDAPASTGSASQTRVERYVRGDQSPRLVLEVDFVADRAPRDGVAEAVGAVFDAILDKPSGVDVAMDDELPAGQGDGEWTFSELQDLVADHADVAEGDDGVVIYTVFVDGHYEADGPGGKVLGLAWSNRYIAMFKDTIEDVCSDRLGALLPSLGESICREAERTIWVHEVGHVIGLVNNGLSMVQDHEDEDHAHHDHDEDCVMFWAYEGDGAVDRLRDRITGGDDTPVGFDAACLADIAAVRDGETD